MQSPTPQSTTTPAWVKDAIFYQIFPDRFWNGDPTNDPPGTEPWGSIPTRENFFGGDIQGIIDKLTYLQDLGINALYLNPVFWAQTNHKYDTCDYLKIDPAFGSLGLFKDFVQEVHRYDMKVILDGVFNHCGAGFWAFEDFKVKGAQSAYKDWFLSNGHAFQSSPPTYQTCGGAHYLPKFNTAHPAVREYLLNVATYWLEETDIDGWRLDVPWKVPMSFWYDFRSAVKMVNPQAYLVGEIWRDAVPWIQGDIFDGAMNYRLRDYILDYCIRDAMDAEDFDFELTALRQSHGSALTTMLNLLGSHDTPRIMTLCQNDSERVKLAIIFMVTYLGAPMIYYGDEVGMQGGNDPLCRGTMVWDEAQWDKSLAQTYRQMIMLRKEHPALRQGDFETLFIFNGVYGYRRSFKQDEVIVVLNPRYAQSDVTIQVQNSHWRNQQWYNILTNEIYIAKNGFLHIPHLASATGLVLLPVAQ